MSRISEVIKGHACPSARVNQANQAIEYRLSTLGNNPPVLSGDTSRSIASHANTLIEGSSPPFSVMLDCFDPEIQHAESTS